MKALAVAPWALLLTVACGRSSSEHSLPANRDAEVVDPAASADVCAGATACHYGLWPRLIVGLIPSSAAMESLEDSFIVQVRIEGDPQLRSARKRACPSSTTPAVCSYGYYAGTAERSLEVVVRSPEGKEIMVPVTLAEINRCGRDIAYLPVSIGDDGTPMAGAVRLISPCD